ncbi:BAHD acyltransferase BIA1-like [Silene latifolia]|uniref:BAHD acyltransferase BIA1-like n=1 Tax=Silene latifolia TaxID=37657 RepID=UPI003D7825D5
MYIKIARAKPTPPKIFNVTQVVNLKTIKGSPISETLVQFYPLAGRIEGNSPINCNDEGAEFYEADVLASLAEVIANPDPEELITISISISHKIADVATSVAFINTWAYNNARGLISSNNHIHTKTVTFDSASFFPPMNLDGFYDPESVICKEKIVTKRLIFDKEKLDELKKKCDNERLEIPD